MTYSTLILNLHYNFIEFHTRHKAISMSEPLEKSNILVVDDIQTNIFVVQTMLTGCNAEILTATSGPEALSIIEKTELALVLLDINMPGMDGYEVAQKMHDNQLTRNIPIIFITACYMDNEHVFKGYKSGAVDYLLKPIDRQILRSKVEIFLRLDEQQRQLKNKNYELQKAYQNINETQSQLARSKKLASIGQLAAGMAHEINNPIGFILSNTSSLQTYFSDFKSLFEIYAKLELAIAQKSSEENILSILDEITTNKEQIELNFLLDDIDDVFKETQSGLERIKKIISDLKNFSGSGIEDNSLVDVHECIESSILLVKSQVQNKIEIEKSFCSDAPIICNASHIKLALMNIILNAAQAIKLEGVVSISTEIVGNDISICIQDSGTGMKKDILSNIFNPFFTTREVGEGSGLGLSVSFDIIKQHKGDINATSQLGEGSKFTVTLPLAKPPQKISAN